MQQKFKADVHRLEEAMNSRQHYDTMQDAAMKDMTEKVNAQAAKAVALDGICKVSMPRLWCWCAAHSGVFGGRASRESLKASWRTVSKR